MGGVLIYLLIFVLAAGLGGQLNRGIYRLAWYRRPIGPWSAPHPDAPPRRWTDRLPIVGWLGLRREADLHGAGFWVRPLVIELGLGVGLAVLYWWEVERAGLMPSDTAPPYAWSLLHAQYLSHVTLLAFMVVATFIDVDEKMIPDAITVPGTLVGLVLLALWPQAAPPVAEPAGLGSYRVAHLLLTSPNAWSTGLDGGRGLGIGLACFAGWCLAIWPRTVTLRRGWVKGGQFLVVSMFRFAGWWRYPLLFAAGAAGIAGGWWRQGATWPSLLTALVGMAFGGGLIWAVRIVAGGALGKEAMGFGDVTLMALIGTFLGWQATPLVFFLAPFVAIPIVPAVWLATRRRDLAFGPYLCVAALIMILAWSPVWETRARLVFSLGGLIPQLMAGCLLLLAGLLGLWRLIERAVVGRHGD